MHFYIFFPPSFSLVLEKREKATMKCVFYIGKWLHFKRPEHKAGTININRRLFIRVYSHHHQIAF